MDFLRSWWREAVDYDWTVNHHRARGSLTAIRVCIGVWSCFFGLAAVLCVRTPGGPRGGVAVDAVVIAAAVTSVGAGVAWIRGPWPSERLALSFVIYSDVAVAAVLFTFENLFLAMPGCALFAVIGAQITAFHSPQWLLAHLVFATAILLALYVCIATTEDIDLRLATARLVVLLPVLLSAPILVQAGLMNLRSDAIDAYRDHLTGLRNRRGLHADFPRAYSPARDSVAVYVVDIDGFKLVNDTRGHHEGDGVLQRLAGRLVDLAGPGALVARIGGEEFAIVCPCPEYEVTEFGRRIVAGVRDSGDDYPVTVSVGAAFSRPAPPWGADAPSRPPLLDPLLRQADAAMYGSKNRGGNRLTVAHQPPHPMH